MRITLTISYLILIIVGVTFAALNATSVPINLYFTKLMLPVSVLMIVMLGLGLCFGFFIFIFRYWRLKVEHRKLSNQLKLTEKEIKNLRSIPLQDQH